jgi:hypothetical protein
MKTSARSRPRRSQRGSLLIVAMMLCGIIGISLVSYYKLAATALKGASRSVLSLSSVNVTEMGLEKAMACFYNISIGTAAATAWSGWTLNTTALTATATFPTSSTSWTIAPNTTAQVKVYVQYYDGSGTPIVVAKSIITPPDGPVINKYVKVTLSSRSLFSSGLVAKDSISWVGNPQADSWDSDPDNNSATAAVGYTAAVQKAGCTVGAVNGSISLGAGGDVYGYSKTGASGTTSGGSVHGLGTTTNDPTRISTDFTASFPAVTVPSPTTFYSIASGSVPTDFPRATDTANAADSTYYYVFGIGASISATTTIGTAVPNKKVVFIMNNHSGSTAIGFTGTKSLTVKTGSSLGVYTDSNISAHGNGLVNGTTSGANQCSALLIYGTATTAGGQSIIVGGNGQLYAGIYAPNASLELKGGGASGMVLGSVVANTISMNGGTDFHYDEALARLSTGAGFKISEWRELQTYSERATYSSNLSF